MPHEGKPLKKKKKHLITLPAFFALYIRHMDSIWLW